MTTTQVFEATVEHLPRISVINLAGRIDSTAQDQLMSAYAAVVGEASEWVVLDFSNVSYMNSSGIALIVNLISRAHRTNRKLAVASLNDHFTHIFEITRLVEYVRLVPDRAAAIELLLREPS
jgi:anti-sigma B factor antagonist